MRASIPIHGKQSINGNFLISCTKSAFEDPSYIPRLAEQFAYCAICNVFLQYHFSNADSLFIRRLGVSNGMLALF